MSEIDDVSVGCKHEIWPASACTLCNPPAKPTIALVPAEEVQARFIAGYTGEECAQCDGTLIEGTPICRVGDGVYAHEKCTEPWAEPRWSL